MIQIDTKLFSAEWLTNAPVMTQNDSVTSTGKTFLTGDKKNDLENW